MCLVKLCHWCWGRWVWGAWMVQLQVQLQFQFKKANARMNSSICLCICVGGWVWENVFFVYMDWLRNNVEHYKQTCIFAIINYDFHPQCNSSDEAIRRQSVLALRMCKIALWIILQKCVRSHQFHSLNADRRRNYSKVSDIWKLKGVLNIRANR